MTRARRQLDDLKRLGQVAGLLAHRAEGVARGEARRLTEARAAAEAADERLLHAEAALAERTATGRSIDPALLLFDIARINHGRLHVQAAGLAVQDAAVTAGESQATWVAGQRREELLSDRAHGAVRSYRQEREDRMQDALPAGPRQAR